MKYIFLLSISLLLLGTAAKADLALNNSILYFEPGEPNHQDVEVENLGDAPLYIQITPRVVRNPGTEQQTREEYDDPTKAGLLVSPNKLVVPPKGRKLLRFVNLNPDASEERVYRVSVTPVVGELNASETGVKVVIAYEVLVLVHPKNGVVDLVHQRQGKSLTIENKGTRNVLVRKGVQCPEGETDETQCDNIPGKRLYPGNRWQTELPQDSPIKVYLSEGTQHTVKVFK